MRVLLRGDHPWQGYSGEIIENPVVVDGSPAMRVRLDNGQEVIAWPAQVRHYPDESLYQRGIQLGVWDAIPEQKAATDERPWPGYCQACGAVLDPPDARHCRTCFAGDDDE
jgi:hypothetical protein